ncbi:MAG: hypothetical protein IKH26_11430 [Bacteroidaceae bacterium]|nr:hypothetical protein [Bacteroidaceae bacterium]
MIPKKIHYCWFGGCPKPKDVLECIASWRKMCPDYEIVEWNETNFDVHINTYCEQAYSLKKWAFVSDVARLYALFSFGGIYMDTDVEVVRDFDDLLHYHAFFGFEGTKWVATSTMASESDNPILKNFMDHYAQRTFIKKDGSLDLDTNVMVFTSMLTAEYGVRLDGQEQNHDLFHLFPTDYFTPYDYITGLLHKTPHTHAIHWFGQSWLKVKSWRQKLAQLYHRLIGQKME